MDGWIILDKESGLFSRTAGGRLARMFGAKTFGHIGTLDPMATGVLPIALGAATKMIPFVEDAQSSRKEYFFSMQFGFETDTLDITGTETVRNNAAPARDAVLAALPQLLGAQMQTPPAYSAIHVGGCRAYDLARRGECVDVPARQVHIYELEMLDFNGASARFRTLCSRGTYVRSIGRDIAKICDCFATVDMIRRTKTNGFDIKDAVKLDFLENLFNNSGDFNKYLKPIDLGLGDIPVINLDIDAAGFYKNGGFISIDADDGLRRVYCDNDFIGMGVIADGVLRPKRTI